MENVSQLKAEYRKSVKAVGDKWASLDPHKRMSLKQWAKLRGVEDGKDYLAMLKTAHKSANKPRSDATIATTRAATLANRTARRNRSNNGKAKTKVTVG